MVNWQEERCNSVAWIYGQLAGEGCNSVAWMYDRLTPLTWAEMSLCNWLSLWVHPVYKIQSLLSIVIIFIGNCCHFATVHLHDYIHFTIYHLELHFWCSEAQAISAISPKACTLKLKLLHNTKRQTKWSGHLKMIDPPENLYTWKTFYPRG